MASNPSTCRGFEEITRIASEMKRRQIIIMTVSHFGRTMESEVGYMATRSEYYYEIYSESQISSVLSIMVTEIIKVSATQRTAVA